MIKSYLKTAIRALLKNKSFAVINMIGLAIGISASIVIYLVVQYDFSFDRQQPDGDRIYRVVSDFAFQGEVSYNAGVPTPLFKTIGQVSGIQQAAPFQIYNGGGIRIEVPKADSAAAVFKDQDKVISCDASYFKLFSYQWLAGSPAASLQQPNRVVLTASRARIYFPHLDPVQAVNKTIIYDDSLKLTVSGIVADIKTNTDFTFHDFISAATFAHGRGRPYGADIDGGYEPNNWSSTTSFDQLFIKVEPNANTGALEQALNHMLRQNAKQQGNNESHTLKLQPLNDLHFNSRYGVFDQRVASRPVLYSLLGVAGFLLLLGCINFINLTTAHSTRRIKEIGVRKTIGGTRRHLIAQFLTETFLLTFMAALLSFGLSVYLLKAFSGFIPPEVDAHLLFSIPVYLFVVGLIVVVTFIAGFYPAVVISGYQPVKAIAGQQSAHTGGGLWLRKWLTVFQFVIAFFFIMTMLLVSRQIRYELDKDLGFKKDAVLYIRTPSQGVENTSPNTFLNRIREIPQVSEAGLGEDAPSSGNSHSTTFTYTTGNKKVETDVEMKKADTSYLHIYQLKLLAGRNLQPADSIGNFIANETYTRLLGFKTPDQAVGKVVAIDDQQVSIIGVVKDFYQKSLQHAIKPAAILYGKQGRSMRTVHIALKPYQAGTGNWQKALNQMETAWKDLYPGQEFRYRFVDESIAAFYESERHTARLLQWATGLSVLISCLGLLGLAMYTTGQRTKEIGIRKVMGASIQQIITLLSIDFMKLILIAFVIAVPIAWVVMHHWLQNYAYHTTISGWIFAAAISGMLAIAMVTMSFQTIKAAAANPVKSLRND